MRYYHLLKPLAALLLVFCLILPAIAQDTGAESGSEDPALFDDNGTLNEEDEYILVEEDYPEDELGTLENASAEEILNESVEGLAEGEVPEESLSTPDRDLFDDAEIYLPASLSATPIWNFSAGERITSTSLTADGSYGVAGTHRPGKIYYFNREGDVEWTRELQVPVYGVSVSPDGTYVAAAAEKLYLFYPHGGEVWSNATGYFVYSVAISREGERIAAGFDDGTIRLFDRNGSPLWSHTTEDNVISTAITPDGSYIAAGSEDHRIYFMDSSGNLLWQFKTGDGVQEIALSSDGSFLGAGSRDRVAYFLDDRGNLLWKYEAQNRITAVSISPEGALAVVCEGSRVHVFDREGRILWEYDTGSNGCQISQTSLGKLYGPDVTASSISSNGHQLAIGTGTGDQRVYCYSLQESSETSLAEASARAAPLLRELEESYLHPEEGNESMEEYAYISSITRIGQEQNSPISVRIAVYSEWLENRTGGIEGIRIMEWSENGQAKVLDTTVVGYDLQNNPILEAISRNSSATYGLASQVTETAPENGEWWSVRSLMGGNVTDTLRTFAAGSGIVTLPFILQSGIKAP